MHSDKTLKHSEQAWSAALSPPTPPAKNKVQKYGPQCSNYLGPHTHYTPEAKVLLVTIIHYSSACMRKWKEEDWMKKHGHEEDKVKKFSSVPFDSRWYVFTHLGKPIWSPLLKKFP